MYHRRHALIVNYVNYDDSRKELLFFSQRYCSSKVDNFSAKIQRSFYSLAVCILKLLLSKDNDTLC